MRTLDGEREGEREREKAALMRTDASAVVKSSADHDINGRE